MQVFKNLKQEMTSYSTIIPIEVRIPAERQSAKRHYGVHPYFTRRPHNLVRRYILHYSYENDRVLDPFGGSGVTAIEAAFENRIGIHNDINPLANFIARGIFDLSKGNLNDYKSSLLILKESCQKELENFHVTDSESLKPFLGNLELPVNIKLPSNSDVTNYYDLFSPTQLVSLATLKHEIDSLPNSFVKNGMLLAWSATLGKLNRTFLSAEGRAESRGGSSIFSIYRYKIAKNPVELSPWETFLERAQNVIAAKEEIDQIIEYKKSTGGWTGRFEDYSLDVEELSEKFNGEVDYIFTDPPYGGHISYLDLSTLWNVWLNRNPTSEMREKELIVGGELKLTEDNYINRLQESIKACFRMLKPNRWISVVFQHWNIKYFEAIFEAARGEGGVLKAAISQVGDPIWSMHKKKNKESVLAGELVLTFLKTEHIAALKKQRNFDVVQALDNILSKSNSSRVYGEAIFNYLVVEAWRSESLNKLNISKQDFIETMNSLGWNYQPENHYWVKNQASEKTLFDLEKY